jgi:hypothetical protein
MLMKLGTGTVVILVTDEKAKEVALVELVVADEIGVSVRSVARELVLDRVEDTELDEATADDDVEL